MNASSRSSVARNEIAVSATRRISRGFEHGAGRIVWIVQQHRARRFRFDAPAKTVHGRPEQFRAVERKRRELDLLLLAYPPVFAEGRNGNQRAFRLQAAQNRT